jgi:hypothetical protein
MRRQHHPARVRPPKREDLADQLLEQALAKARIDVRRARAELVQAWITLVRRAVSLVVFIAIAVSVLRAVL